MKKAVATLSGLFLFFLCVDVFAQTPPRDGRSQGADPRLEQAIDSMFQEIDASRDGRISSREWLAAQERQFRKLDRDGDGSVTKSEIRADMTDKMRGSQGPGAGRGRP